MKGVCMVNETKEKILAVSLELFSQKGYTAVSIRDICKQVGIKESSVYYHFENKQAVFDEILSRFQKKATDMMKYFESAMIADSHMTNNIFSIEVCNCFFEKYLMDDFCNKVMRLMLIEQFNNESVKMAYDYWMFTKPLEFQSSIFQMLLDRGVIPDTDSKYAAIQYYAPIFFFAQKWLFSGSLSDENKNAFRKDAYKHIQNFFSTLGGV